jgi:hypothetical protein
VIEGIAEGSIEGCDDEEGSGEDREEDIGSIPSSRASTEPSSATKVYMVAERA